MKNIYIVTSRYNFFGRGIRGWESLDLQTFIKIFSKLGNTQILNIDDLVNKRFSSNDILIIGCDPSLIQQKYHIDVLEFLLERDHMCIYPELSLIKAHENKGYQELLKKRLNIESLNGYYFSSLEAINTIELNYPIVYKKTTGAGSSGVALVKNNSELVAIIIKNSYISWLDKLKLFVRKYSYSFEAFEEYRKSKHKISPYVLQPFVQGLKYDYKVLCFDNKYYSLKRFVRDNDFRASGSGKLNFDKPPISLVQFAMKIKEALGTPVISLDICWDGNGYNLIEFQACHFGPSTLTKSIGYYQFHNFEWQYIEEPSNLTEVFCNAYVNYISRINGK